MNAMFAMIFSYFNGQSAGNSFVYASSQVAAVFHAISGRPMSNRFINYFAALRNRTAWTNRFKPETGKNNRTLQSVQATPACQGGQ